MNRLRAKLVRCCLNCHSHAIKNLSPSNAGTPVDEGRQGKIVK